MQQTSIQLTAEEIAANHALLDGDANRQAIEDAYAAQTPREVWVAALARADRWPSCGKGTAWRRGLQYAYLLEFLICDESTKAHLRKGEF